MERDQEGLQAAIGHAFADPALLALALTHRSYVYETPGAPNVTNERLEFLGDAVLAYVAAHLLFRTFPDLSEGELTAVRSVLVREPTLAGFARDLRLGDYLRLGRGEEHNGGRERDPILAGAFEAVVGALALDGGQEAAAAFVTARLAGLAARVVAERTYKDSKSEFQEAAQARRGQTPSYRVVAAEGPAHQPRFTVEVVVGELVVARGEGTSKQRAEQAAARAALAQEGWRSDRMT